MSFPTVAATATTTTASGTTHTVNLPSGIAAGHRLVLEFAGSTSAALTFPGGWNSVVTLTAPSFTPSVRGQVAYHDCDGTEGATISVTSASSTVGAWIVRRITGHDPALAPVGGAARSDNPPNLNPATWDVLDTLWGVAHSDDRSGATVTTWPTNYTANQQSALASATCYSATREVAAASEDPATFVMSGSNDPVAMTWACAGLAGIVADTAVGVATTAGASGQVADTAAGAASTAAASGQRADAAAGLCVTGEGYVGLLPGPAAGVAATGCASGQVADTAASAATAQAQVGLVADVAAGIAAAAAYLGHLADVAAGMATVAAQAGLLADPAAGVATTGARIAVSPDPDRTLDVQADDRTLDISSDGRTLDIGADDRTLDIGG